VGTWALLFSASVIQTIYGDHRYWVRKAQELETEIPSKNAQIEELKARLVATCFMPDRRLTAEQRDKLYEGLKATAQKYHHPHFRIGYFDGDTESLRYAGILAPILHDAGFIPDRDIVRRPRVAQNDPADPGFREGLSIQEEADSPAFDPLPQKIVMEIAQNFGNAQVEMQPYPVGSHWPVKKTGGIVIWVGYKKVDWLSLSK
jgi:hypothetical protein